MTGGRDPAGGRGDVRVDVFGCCMDNHVKASFEANSELAMGEEVGGKRLPVLGHEPRAAPTMRHRAVPIPIGRSLVGWARFL